MSFNQIYGHKENKDKFNTLLENNRVSHSYIFDGVDGIGKRFFAINLVKALLCENKENDACEVCSSCKKINSFNHPDLKIIEPDGNSIKNEQIKEFRKFLNYKPNESDRKIIIIDNSEKLTISSQNTILKVLEEPPEYALIIFITNNVNLLLDTVKSRCQFIKFNRLKNDEIIKFLLNEKNVSNDDAKIISVFSDGVVYKAISALESEDFINLREKVINYSNSILFSDKINSIKGINFLNKEKDNISVIFDIMIIWFRDIVIFKNTNNIETIINKDKKEMIKKNAYRLIDKDIVKMITLINDSIEMLAMNMNYKLVIDNLIINMIEVGEV